jgi:dihydrofolate reductase
MRKVILSMQVSLDGFIARPNGELDWHLVDEEFNEYARDLLDTFDILVFGRVTYELMAASWPTATTNGQVEAHIAERLNALPKVVFSRTLKKVEWRNSMLAQGGIVEEILKLKQQPGKDIGIGGRSIVSALAPLCLIDEYRILVVPIVLGRGKSLFEGIKESVNLELRRTKTFGSGLVLLVYGPEKRAEDRPRSDDKSS